MADHYSFPSFVLFLFLLLLLVSFIRSQGPPTIIPSPPPPISCPLITLYDSPPPFLYRADDVFVPHINTLRKYSPPTSVLNWTVVHQAGGKGTAIPPDDDPSLCNWWITFYPEFLMKNSIDDAMKRTIAQTGLSLIALFILPNSAVNSIDELFRSLIIKYRSSVTNNNTAPIVIEISLPGIDRPVLDFIHQLEKRFGDLFFVNYRTQLDVGTVIKGMLAGTVSAFISGPLVAIQNPGLFKAIAVTGDQATHVLPETMTFLQQGYRFRSELRVSFTFSPNALRVNSQAEIDAMKEWSAVILDRVARDLQWAAEQGALGGTPMYYSATKSLSMQKLFISIQTDLLAVKNSARPLLPEQPVSLSSSIQRSILVILLSLVSIWVTSILLETVRSDLRQIKKSDSLTNVTLGKDEVGRYFNKEYLKRKEELLKTQLPPFFRKHKTLYRALPHLLLGVSSILFIVATLWSHGAADISAIFFHDIDENNSFLGTVPNDISFDSQALFLNWLIAFVFCYGGFQLIIRESITESFIVWNHSFDRWTRDLFDDQKKAATVYRKRNIPNDPSVLSSDQSDAESTMVDSDPTLNKQAFNHQDESRNHDEIAVKRKPTTLRTLLQWRFLSGGMLVGVGYTPFSF